MGVLVPAYIMSNASSTGSEIDSVVTTTVMIIVYVIYSAVMVIGTLVNPVIILTIARTRSLRTAMNGHLVSQAFSDMVVSVVVIPCRLALYNRAHFPDNLQLRCKLDVFLKTMCDCVQFAMLGGMSFERYKSVSKPFDKQNSQRRTMLTVTLSWLWAIAVGAVTSIKFGDSVTIYPCYREFSTHTKIPFIKFSEAFITLPLCIICLCLIIVYYVLMIQTLKEHNTKMKRRGKVAPMSEKKESYRTVKTGVSGGSPDTTTTRITAVSTDTPRQVNHSNIQQVPTTSGSPRPSVTVKTETQLNTAITDKPHITIHTGTKETKTNNKSTFNKDDAVKVHVLTRQNLFRTNSSTHLYGRSTYASSWRRLIEDTIIGTPPSKKSRVKLRSYVERVIELTVKKNTLAAKQKSNSQPQTGSMASPPGSAVDRKAMLDHRGRQQDTDQSGQGSPGMSSLNEVTRTPNIKIGENNTNVKTRKIGSGNEKGIAPSGSGKSVFADCQSQEDNLSLNNSQEILQNKSPDRKIWALQKSNYNNKMIGRNSEEQSIPVHMTTSDVCGTDIAHGGTTLGDTANTKPAVVNAHRDRNVVNTRHNADGNSEIHKNNENEIKASKHESENYVSQIEFNSYTDKTVTNTRKDLLSVPLFTTDTDGRTKTDDTANPGPDTFSKVDVVEMDGTVHKNVAVEGAVVGAVCVMNTSNRLQGRRKVEMRTAKRIAILIASFVILWLPLPVTALFLSSEKQTSPSDLETLLVSGSISALTGAFNPLFNLLLNKQLRSASIRVIKNGIKFCKRC